MKSYRVLFQGYQFHADFPATPEGDALAGQWIGQVIDQIRNAVGPVSLTVEITQ